MIKLTQITETFGDCTAGYLVTLDRPYTVQEFIQAVITEKPNEWGYIGIKDNHSFFGNPQCEYRQGKLLSNLPKDYLDKSIIEVTAHGGWSSMDYLLTL